MRLAFPGKWLLGLACYLFVVSALWGQGPPNAGQRLLREALPPEVPDRVIQQAVQPPAKPDLHIEDLHIDPNVLKGLDHRNDSTSKDEFWGWCREHWLMICIILGAGAGAGGIFKSRQ
jgi:hypothetical protein